MYSLTVSQCPPPSAMAYRRYKVTRRRKAKTPKASKSTKALVKAVIQRMKPKQVLHNGPGAADQLLGQQLTPVANFWQNIRTLSLVNQGNSEYQRTGDQIYIHRIKMRLYMDTTASNDAVRVAIIRQKSTGQTPTSINPNLCYQVVTPGIQGVISETQDDKNLSILYDKVWTLGIGAGQLENRIVNIDLKFKNPLPVIYYDGTVTPTTLTTVEGDIALCVTSVVGVAGLYYQYEVHFSEK